MATLSVTSFKKVKDLGSYCVGQNVMKIESPINSMQLGVSMRKVHVRMRLWHFS